ncbi:uncharacterized protein LOC134185262 [Corticium candelabrum]|uniref:uncharacterized protein LOC134185262 n=1 Tax=Corticium candelabrum TaxID=121492 RepID=UPI002E2557F8|nr:uncharacterized protein LOC134185262 [Corticium candelabrum]
MANATNITSVTGVTSRFYHITMWAMIVAGILANVVVIVWRCRKKESRLNLLSGLIISLAVADLCMCFHFLLQEVMLSYPVFAQVRQDTPINTTRADEILCLSITFLAYFCSSAIMLLCTGIALRIFCQFRRQPRRCSRFFTGYLVFTWVFSATYAAIVTWQYKQHNRLPQPIQNVNEFSLIVIFGCVNSIDDSELYKYLIPMVGINAALSLLVAVLYIYLCSHLRKHKVIFPNSSENNEIDRLRIRLIIISVLNLVCTWLPGFAIGLYTVANMKTVYNGSVSPISSEPFFILTAAITVANPLIYTIASVTCCSRLRHCCCNHLLCRRRVMLVRVKGHAAVYKADYTLCNACCLKRSSVKQVLEDTEILFTPYNEATSNDTEESRLFTD